MDKQLHDRAVRSLLMSPQDVLLNCARPVLFEGFGHYGGFGSSVLIASGHYYYWLTAKHVITEQDASIEQLRIFPTDHSRMSIPYDQWREITTNDVDDECRDLYCLRIDLNQFSQSGDSVLGGIDINVAYQSPRQLTVGTPLKVIGFPGEFRGIDYEKKLILSRRFEFDAIYSGKQSQHFFHELRISDMKGISDCNGLSGSPVFGLLDNGEGKVPLFAGILVRGSASTGVCSFISIEPILKITE